MNSCNGERAVKRKHSQRWLASVLLFLFVSDIGFHVAESLMSVAEGPAATELRSSYHNPEPGGCGIPGHSGTPFHHHHFPGVINQASFALALTTFASVSRIPAPDAIHNSIITALGRAPPLS